MKNLLTVVLVYDVLSSGGSLPLIGSPSIATEGDFFTLTCGNRSSVSHTIHWYLNDTMEFTTNYEPGSQNDCTIGRSDSSRFKYMSERVTVSCDTHQHNVTLTINSTLDSGSVWFCENNTGNVGPDTKPRSVKLVISITTVRTSTYGLSTSSSTLDASYSDNYIRDRPNALYMAAAAVVGAVVAVVFVLTVLWVRRRIQRNGRQIDGVPSVPDRSTVNVYDSPSAPEDMEHQYCQVQGGAVTVNYVNTEVAAEVTAEGDAGGANYYNSVGNT